MPVIQTTAAVLGQHTEHAQERGRGGPAKVRKENDRGFRLDPMQAGKWRAGDPEGCAMVVGSGIPGVKVQEVTSAELGQPNYVEAVWAQDGRLFKGIVVGTDHTSTIPQQVLSVNDADKMALLVAMLGNGVDLEIIGVTSSVRRTNRPAEKPYKGTTVTRSVVKGRGCRAADDQFREIAAGTRAQLDTSIPAEISALGDEAAIEYKRRYDSRVATLQREAQHIPHPRRSNRKAVEGRRPLA